MDSFAQMNIFFFITSAVVLSVGILMALILWKVFRILGHVERLSETVSEEGALLRHDIAEARNRFGTVISLASITSLFTNTIKRARAPRVKRVIREDGREARGDEEST